MSDNIGITVYLETKRKLVGYRENLKTYVRCCEISHACVITRSDLKLMPRQKIAQLLESTNVALEERVSFKFRKKTPVFTDITSVIY